MEVFITVLTRSYLYKRVTGKESCTPEPILTNLERKAHNTMTSLVANGASNTTYLVFDSARWSTSSTDWTDLPGAKIQLDVGQGAPSYGAIFVATFSAEVLCQAPDNNGVVFATVFFGDTQSEPSSDNHRYASANGGLEWSSHTFIRTLRVAPGLDVRDVSAQVKIECAADVSAGIQNWVLKVERYNI